MSRPQEMHKGIKGDFNEILGAIAVGDGKGKKAAVTLLARKKRDFNSQRSRKNDGCTKS